MKKIVRFLTVIMVFGLIVGLSGFTADNNGAGVTKDAGCNLFDGFGILVSATDDITVTNHGGNTTLVCKAKDVATPGVTVKMNGFRCNTLAGPATNSQSVVSADGNSTLRCQIKKPKD